MPEEIGQQFVSVHRMTLRGEPLRHVGAVTLQSVHASVRISADLDEHIAWIREYVGLGFDDIYLHFVGQDQSRFVQEFGAQVLPACREG